MLSACGPKPVGEAEEVGFVDLVEYLHRHALNEFVFEQRDAERSLPPVRLRDVHPMHRLRPVRSALQSLGEVLEIFLKRLAVVPPCLSVHTGSRLPVQLQVGEPQKVDPVYVVPEQ